MASIFRNKRLEGNKLCTCGSLAQLGEHLPYKQRVIGSSPIVPTIALVDPVRQKTGLCLASQFFVLL